MALARCLDFSVISLMYLSCFILMFSPCTCSKVCISWTAHNSLCLPCYFHITDMCSPSFLLPLMPSSICSLKFCFRILHTATSGVPPWMVSISIWFRMKFGTPAPMTQKSELLLENIFQLYHSSCLFTNVSFSIKSIQHWEQRTMALNLNILQMFLK